MVAALTVVLILLVIAAAISVSPKRQRELSEIIADLRTYRRSAPESMHYAIDENVYFMRAVRTFPGFLYWGFVHRRKMDGRRLFEIADMPLPRWEKRLYEGLSRVERKEFPGLSKPLRKLLAGYLSEKPGSKLLDLGCGSMEAERQALVELHRTGKLQAPLLVGVDLAPQAYAAIRENYADFEGPLEIKKISSLKDIDRMSVSTPTILFYCGNALDAAQEQGSRFDLIFSSRFRHHLDDGGKRQLDAISRSTAHHVVEYDDFLTGMSWLPPFTVAWYNPVLLAAGLFSHLRQPTKKELLAEKKAGQPLMDITMFSPPGTYIKAYLPGTAKKGDS